MVEAEFGRPRLERFLLGKRQNGSMHNQLIDQAAAILNQEAGATDKAGVLSICGRRRNLKNKSCGVGDGDRSLITFLERSQISSSSDAPFFTCS
jgi:hypothetical protein